MGDRVKALGRGVGRWGAELASVVGALLLGLCGVVFFGVEDATDTQRGWAWVCYVAGLVCQGAAAFLARSRELTGESLRGQLVLRSQEAAAAERRANQAQNALELGLRSRLMALSEHLELSTGGRLTLYAATDGRLVRRARYWKGHTAREEAGGRAQFQDFIGLAGDARLEPKASRVAAALDSFRAGSSPRVAWEQWMAHLGNQPLSSLVIADLRMESRVYLFTPLLEPGTDRLVGLLVVEHLDPSGVRLSLFRAAMASRSRDLVEALLLATPTLQEPVDGSTTSAS